MRRAHRRVWNQYVHHCHQLVSVRRQSTNNGALLKPQSLGSHSALDRRHRMRRIRHTATTDDAAASAPVTAPATAAAIRFAGAAAHRTAAGAAAARRRRRRKQNFGACADQKGEHHRQHHDDEADGQREGLLLRRRAQKEAGVQFAPRGLRPRAEAARCKVVAWGRTRETRLTSSPESTV